MRSLIAVMLLFLPLMSWAAVPETDFEDPQQERRYQQLSDELRCLVCQGQSIGDSDADLAVDLRNEVRRQILAGRSDAEIVNYMTERYGDFVLFRPPLKAGTMLLWIGPFVLLALGAGWMLIRIRSRKAAAEYTDEQRLQARELLEGRREP